ncbi:hypothetical protein ASD79_14180 [Caulobacter sp. Root655]|jgi:hypothetical protein|uniref:hypothetical protein n=1 Tax=Caulobacter sp. Root655 TaxID=1736578 RepID=UPI0006F75D67|nr:hypothetical protein [Caulobacter sp. Root655]KRA58456.1 hypothetical protein ASD79_14180 [Caulobacter sp. Root655]
MAHDTVATSASLYLKADELDLLALKANSPGHASIYRRVANANRVAAAVAKISETMDYHDALAGVGKDHVG